MPRYVALLSYIVLCTLFLIGFPKLPGKQAARNPNVDGAAGDKFEPSRWGNDLPFGSFSNH